MNNMSNEIVSTATSLLSEAVTMVTESELLNPSPFPYLDSTTNVSEDGNYSMLDNDTATGSPPVVGVGSLLKTTLFHTQVIFTPIVCFVGIVGNILNLVVLSRKEMRSSTSCFLIGLAVSDLLLCTVAIPQSYFAIAKEATGTQTQGEILMSRYYNIALYYIANVCITCTSWMTVSVTVERFIAIRLPHRVRLICTVKRARIAIPILFLISILGHLSKCFEYKPNPDPNSPFPKLPTDLGKDRVYQSTLHWMNISLAVVIPFFSLVIVNSLLVYSLIQYSKSPQLSMKTNKNTASQHRHTIHITTAVIAMVTVFLVCHSLGIYTAFNIAVHGRKAVFSDQRNYAVAMINNLLVFVNSSVNFILYCLISSRFRQMFKLAFCGVKETKKKSNAPLNMQNLPRYKLSTSSGGTASTSVSSAGDKRKLSPHNSNEHIKSTHVAPTDLHTDQSVAKLTSKKDHQPCAVISEDENTSFLPAEDKSHFNNNTNMSANQNARHSLDHPNGNDKNHLNPSDASDPLLSSSAQVQRSSSAPDSKLRVAAINKKNTKNYSSERKLPSYRPQQFNQDDEDTHL